MKRRTTSSDGIAAVRISSPSSSKCSLRGQVLKDLRGNSWKLGPPIGMGGFGEIYLASDDITKPVTEKSDYVVKIESFTSGPLFVEVHVYSKLGKRELIEKWMEEKKIKSLGIPHFLGYGSHYYNNERFRFIVLPKYGIDLQTALVSNGGHFNLKTAFTIATYVIDVLEYTHSAGYVHADVKASNLVLSRDHRAPVYVLDYGLSCKYRDDTGNHKRFECDQRKAHGGTLAFTSRDAHSGEPLLDVGTFRRGSPMNDPVTQCTFKYCSYSRRGDLEMLGYNIVQWIAGWLPWDGITDAEDVARVKADTMADVDTFVGTCFEWVDAKPSVALIQYLKYVNKLKFKSEPDYKYCKLLFRKAVRDAGYTYNGELSLKLNVSNVSKKRIRRSSDRENDDVNMSMPDDLVALGNNRKPCTVRNCNTRMTRKSTTSPLHFDWPKILASNPEKPTTPIMTYQTPQSPPDDWDNVPPPDSADSMSLEHLHMRGLTNPTPYMTFVLNRGILKMKDRTVLNNLNFYEVACRFNESLKNTGTRKRKLSFDVDKKSKTVVIRKSERVRQKLYKIPIMYVTKLRKAMKNIKSSKSGKSNSMKTVVKKVAKNPIRKSKRELNLRIR